MKIPGLFAAAAALALTASATPALAESANLGTIASSESAGYIFTHPKGAFTDTVAFVINSAGTGSVDYFNFLAVGSKGPLANIKDAMLSLSGPTSFTTALAGGASYPLTLAGGAYTGTITGVANGASGGSYLFQVAAPTPEPEAFAMMGVGLALAGYLARRRKQKSAA